MTDCAHKDLELLGSQKTDSGENKYMRCRSCGDVIVVTAGRRAFALKGADGSSVVSGRSADHP